MRTLLVILLFLATIASANHDCEGETVNCFDHHLGIHITYRNADSCGIYFDHSLGYHVVFPYCSASACGGNVAICFDHCFGRHEQFVNKNACKTLYNPQLECNEAYGHCEQG